MKMVNKIGDYLIKGIRGEFYFCEKDIFEQTYEKVDDQNIDNQRECVCASSLY